MKEAYKQINFRKDTLALIETMNEIIEDLAGDGYTLTVRQLYYQLVARDRIENKQSEYKRIVAILSDARLAGLVDWDYIEDRTRGLRALSHWNNPAEVVQSAASSFRVDKWSKEYGQTVRPEVWVEKDALVNVLQNSCNPLDVPYFSCRGYTSLSEVRAAALRAKFWAEVEGQTPFIIHLGDHDPSGKDMTRDIIARFKMFVGYPVEVKRIALNYGQIKRFKPPPNPAKEADSRYGAYVREFGPQCWELDALSPRVLAGLINETVKKVRDDEAWEKALKHEEEQRATLQKAADKWPAVAKFVNRPARKRKPTARKTSSKKRRTTAKRKASRKAARK